MIQQLSSTLLLISSILLTGVSSSQSQSQSPFLLSAQPESQSTLEAEAVPLLRISIHSNQSQLNQLNSILSEHSINNQVDIWRKSNSPCSTDNHNQSTSTSDSICLDFTASDQISEQIQQIPQLNIQILQKDVHQLVKQQRSDRERSQKGKDLLSALKHKSFPPPPHSPNEDDSIWHDSYHSLEEISTYIQSLTTRYPSQARVSQIGLTSENRPIEALILTSPPRPSRSPSKPRRNLRAVPGSPRDLDQHLEEESKKLGFVFVGELHAREWISTSTLLHFASSLLSTNDPLLEIFEITIIPLGNPDGYVHTWEEDRFWRKNRQENKEGEEIGECKGLNLGSNWGHEFQPSPISESCSESYSGSEAFEAKETLAIKDYVDDKERNIKGFLEVHSYGQLLMYPFSFSCDQMVPDEEDLAEVSLGASRALRDVHGRVYQTGKACDTLFPASGSAIDYFYSSSPAKVKWSFSIELRDTGTYGFLLPPTQIKPTSEEFQAAALDLLNFIKMKEKR